MTSAYNTYNIELVASNRLADTDPVVTWTQTITVIINDGCNDDVLLLVSSTFLATYDYYIDENTENPGKIK